MKSNTEFSSEGFDLDAVGNDPNAVLELGGDVTTTVEVEPEPPTEADPLVTSEQHKTCGNEQFKAGNYLDAYDMYTEAIEACPGMTGDELLKLRDAFDEEQRELAVQRYREEDAERRRKEQAGEKVSPDQSRDPPLTFQPPFHPHGHKLAVYYCNRAACLLHLHRYDAAIADCDVAILLHPTYTKAWVRRSTAYENTERTEEALVDAKKALELEPANLNVRKTVTRLQKLEDERIEKLKEETMGKLKDLGNSILGNFGLSLDNFKAVQDPNTGSYSISFGNDKS